MPTRVLLLRHAESANPAIFHGSESDVGLSERGQRQAEALAPVLAACKPDRLISSAMLRARATVVPLARTCGLTVQIEPALHERSVGSLSGTPTGLRDGVWPETLSRWLAGDTAYAPEGAESFDQIRTRVLPVWERVTTAAEGQTLIIVAHGVICRVLLLCVLPGYTVADWPRLGPIHNVALHELVRDQLPQARSASDGEAHPSLALRACGRGEWQAVRLNEIPAEVRSVG